VGRRTAGAVLLGPLTLFRRLEGAKIACLDFSQVNHAVPIGSAGGAATGQVRDTRTKREAISGEFGDLAPTPLSLLPRMRAEGALRAAGPALPMRLEIGGNEEGQPVKAGRGFRCLQPHPTIRSPAQPRFQTSPEPSAD